MIQETVWVDANDHGVNIEQVRGKRVRADGSRVGRPLNDAELIELGYKQVTINERPDDFSDELYTRTGPQMDYPYIFYTKKSEEQLAEVRWNKLKQIRDNLLLSSGAKVGDKWFHSDTHSKVQQLSLVLAGANLPSGIQWKTMDGTFVTMTPALAASIYQAQMAQELAIFQTAEFKKLDSTLVNEGWPEHFKTAEELAAEADINNVP